MADHDPARLGPFSRAGFGKDGRDPGITGSNSPIAASRASSPSVATQRLNEVVHPLHEQGER
jgi:hypothetical protein